MVSAGGGGGGGQGRIQRLMGGGGLQFVPSCHALLGAFNLHIFLWHGGGGVTDPPPPYGPGGDSSSMHEL